MAEKQTYRVRFRFHLHKKLSVTERERRLTIAGREIVLKSPRPDTDIADDDWLVMNARGFDSEQSAINFGRRLKAAVDLSSVIARLGIDSGVDKPTSGFGKIVKDAALARDGTVLRDNVHGIDVFVDDPNVRIGQFSMTGTVRASPDPFLADLDDLYKVADGTTPGAKDIVLLLNYALTRADPVAQIVFAVSAVEMLGQNEKWTERQRQLLNELAVAAERGTVGTAKEREEVAAAIRRGMQRISLRQGVFRLLESLGLSDLRKKWDELYEERSTLVHGLAPNPGVRYDDLAFRTVNLCGQILLTAVGREVQEAKKHLDKFYPLT